MVHSPSFPQPPKTYVVSEEGLHGVGTIQTIQTICTKCTSLLSGGKRSTQQYQTAEVCCERDEEIACLCTVPDWLM